MTENDFIAILPLLVVTSGAVLILIAIAFRRRHSVAATLSIAVLTGAFASLWLAASVAPRQVTTLLLIDGFALFYIGVILVSSGVVALLAYRYFETHPGRPEELYVLLLIATAGCITVIASTQFVSFFLGLEILSVSLYAMVAYLNDRRHALEAGIKYLTLAAASSAFLLFGMALIYADLGTMDFARIGRQIGSAGDPGWISAGMALILTGIGFKLGLVPFHLWTPDVYQGAPAPVTAFLATASKTAMVAVLLRFFYLAHAAAPMLIVFAIVAVASMLAGNLLALLQSNLKRILAYSSIAHFGYVLVPFVASGAVAVAAITFYLAVYSVTILAAFGIIAVLSTSERDADRLEDYRGLFWQRPVMAVGFTVVLLSLAGIPVTAGFFAKFYIIAASASAGLWSLLVVLIVSSTIGLYYYLRVVVMIYSPSLAITPGRGAAAFAGGAVVAILAVVLVWLGIYPAPLLHWIQNSPLTGV